MYVFSIDEIRSLYDAGGPKGMELDVQINNSSR